MTLVKTLLIAVFATLAFNCSSTQKGMNSDSETGTKVSENASEEVQMMENGFLKGTIVAYSEEGECPYVIRVEDKEMYFLDPINIDETYKKDGMKIWFTFRGLRMMNRCQKANPIEINEIKSR